MAIAAGGGLGSVARYLLSQAFPAGHGFPWAIFAINVSGCSALGMLMVFLLDVWPPRRLLRPFLAIGLIGGYTTFSTYAAGIWILIQGGRLALAVGYALTSVLAGLVALWCGLRAARAMAGLPARPGRLARTAARRGPAAIDPAAIDPDRMTLDIDPEPSVIDTAERGPAEQGPAGTDGRSR